MTEDTRQGDSEAQTPVELAVDIPRERTFVRSGGCRYGCDDPGATEGCDGACMGWD
jgi:hypothetical protein